MMECGIGKPRHHRREEKASTCAHKKKKPVDNPSGATGFISYDS
jgi:hypothetical protein